MPKPIVLILCTCFITVHGADWDYGAHGPTQWATDYPDCGGSSQSPVDIQGAVNDPDVVPEASLQWTNIDTANKNEYTLVNNGHSAEVKLPESPVTVTGGLLTDTYQLAQFHFHWGSNSSQGSEHEIAGKQFPLEMHLVHYSTQYDTFSDAATQPDGLAVVGVLFEEGSEENEAFSVITEALVNIQSNGDSTDLSPFAIGSLFEPATTKYYQYRGSLTTPGCYESVIWTVCSEPVKISATQLGAFRQLTDANGYPMVDNFRPVQPINDRLIYKSWECLTEEEVEQVVAAALQEILGMRYPG